MLELLTDMAAGATESDREGGYPETEILKIAAAGFLRAPFPDQLGGSSLGSRPGDGPDVLALLRAIGTASLPLGRLYEGHLNAVSLVIRYGSEENLALLHDEAMAGRLTGVWMAEASPGLALAGARLDGAKIFCSGAGHIRRPLVGARIEGAAGPQMVLPLVDEAWRSSTERWRAFGMKASATGDVDFTGIEVGADALVGQPNDYYQSPWFRGGAWRVLAVQLGGLDRLLALFRTGLKDPAPVALARFGEAVAHWRTASLWVEDAANLADDESLDPLAIDAAVDLARGAFERAAMAMIELVERGLGLRALIAPNPLERQIRDLTTYLRQPALDLSLTSAASYVLKGGRLPGMPDELPEAP